MRRTASLVSGVLLVGERGADAPAIARELHARSRPAGAPWIAIDCGADNAARIDRGLFGTARNHGATDLESVSSDSYTVAARGGTLFLQDVTELPSAIQARLTRIARDGEVRVDGEVVPTEVRFVASAWPSIDDDVREHRFRADLYRRLAASRIDLPPLRDRLEDVPMLATRLLEDCSGAEGQAAANVHPGGAGAAGCAQLARQPGRAPRPRRACRRRNARPGHSDRATAPGATVGSRDNGLRSSRQPPRCPAPLRTRLHRRCSAASWLADG